MKRKGLVITLGVLTAAILVLLFTWESIYITRVLVWNEVSILDYKIFPERELETPSETFRFVKDTTIFNLEAVNENFKEKFEFTNVDDFEELLQLSGTTAFLILKNDTLIYENYLNGYERNSINTSFSVSKSFTSALVGIAIDEGYISSVHDPISKYLEELQGEPRGEITIEELLTMSSPIAYDTESRVFGDEARAYYEPDLRDYALEFELEPDSVRSFEYNNIHPLLLGMILERSTGVKMTEYLEEKIWKPLGAEFSGSWSLDNSGFEKMESGINASSIDFLKFGRLFLNEGRWDNRQVISESYIRVSTVLTDDDQHLRNVVPDKRSYKYFWWIMEREGERNDFYGEGNLGQFIYVSPSTNTVFVRNAKYYGYGRWPEFFFKLAKEL